MRWQPELDEQEEKDLKTQLMSENTAHQKWATEISKKENLIDDDFLKRNKNRILSFDKYAPLGFFNDKRIFKLDRRRRIIITLAENAGLYDVAETAALDNIADINMSRGWDGAYSKINVTERHEHKIQESKTQQEKLGRLGGLFGKKKPETEYTTEFDTR